jgi:hypothetical protein
MFITSAPGASAPEVPIFDRSGSKSAFFAPNVPFVEPSGAGLAKFGKADAIGYLCENGKTD